MSWRAVCTRPQLQRRMRARRALRNRHTAFRRITQRARYCAPRLAAEDCGLVACSKAPGAEQRGRSGKRRCGASVGSATERAVPPVATACACASSRRLTLGCRRVPPLTDRADRGQLPSRLSREPRSAENARAACGCSTRRSTRPFLTGSEGTAEPMGTCEVPQHTSAAGGATRFGQIYEV